MGALAGLTIAAVAIGVGLSRREPEVADHYGGTTNTTLFKRF